MCARAKKPCSTCLPMKEGKYVNTLPLCVDLMIDSSCCNAVLSVTSAGSTTDHVRGGSMDYHMSLAVEQRYDFHVNSSSYINDSAFSNSQGLSTLGPEISCSSLDKMMTVAYGDKLLYSDGGPRDSV